MSDRPSPIANLKNIPIAEAPEGHTGPDVQWVSPYLTAKKLDVTTIILAPGQSSAPYHFHYGSEELFLVLAGDGTVRHGEEDLPVQEGDFISCPVGPGSAHRFTNLGEKPMVLLAVSTVVPVDAVEYPENDLMGVAIQMPGGRALKQRFPKPKPKTKG